MKQDTKVVSAGRHPQDNFGVVNPPVYHASTILFPSLEVLENYPNLRVRYGRHGTPGTQAFEEAMAELEGADHCALAPSGMAAISAALLSFLKSGDHLLMVDTTYDPARVFCDEFLAQLGIETTYYDPLIGSKIADLMRPNTRVVYTESPGSMTFEVQDIRAISQAAKNYEDAQQNVIVMMDNTWSTSLYFKPLEHGIDVAVQSISKYVGGHADVIMGTICCRDAHWPDIHRGCKHLGLSVGPDDVYLAQRGLRTLSARLKQHSANAMRLAAWLNEQPVVKRLIYPALPGNAGHELWKRDFSGATSLFGIVLQPGSREQARAMLNGMTHFGLGVSWGGYESLLIPLKPHRYRSATQWTEPGAYFRIHVGLEDPDDLIEDLDAGLRRFTEAAQ